MAKEANGLKSTLAMTMGRTYAMVERPAMRWAGSSENETNTSKPSRKTIAAGRTLPERFKE